MRLFALGPALGPARLGGTDRPHLLPMVVPRMDGRVGRGAVTRELVQVALTTTFRVDIAVTAVGLWGREVRGDQGHTVRGGRGVLVFG